MLSFNAGKKDILIIAVLLLAAVAVWSVQLLLYGDDKTKKAYAEIVINEEVAERISLNEDSTFSIDKLPNVIFEVNAGRIAFVQSDCPDKVCVHTGWLKVGGQFAACLPNKVILRIVDEDTEGVDAVAG